ncbi:MAG: N-acetylmuramoyl-L-alanine amidase, partial [Desulfotomaculaceae bacterium]|nr:N-acetylmuramoyl-L-alanine amidase [Desulfotomaculaceae bacterium]
MTIIMLDPGHGGSDPGAVGYGLQEKDLTLDIAGQTRDALRSYAVDVYLTRNADIDFEPAQRAELANRLGAGYFLSLHINAGGGTGFESYVHPNAGDRSLALRNIIHKRVSSFYSSSGSMDRGEKSANFAVLRLTRMPALLLENLFIDTAVDAAKLADPVFRQHLAGAITAGLVQALGLTPVSGGGQVGEINKLKSDGLIISDHDQAVNITWGTFAAVINRSRSKSSLSGPWDPAGEVAKLKADRLIFSDHDEGEEVPWGEFAAVLNRLRGRSPWDPVAEIKMLKSDGLLDSAH